jgi:dynein heavy chain, axonemal
MIDFFFIEMTSKLTKFRRIEPKAFWLGAFTFPTGFLTAILQKTARKNNVPVDILAWEFNVLQLEDDNQIPPSPKEGVYIRSLFLEGAR